MRPGPARTSVAAVFLFALVTCSETPVAPDPPEAATIELSASTLQVDDGDSATLAATVYDQYGDPMQGATVTWGSADPDIATVSGGVVSGVYPGQTTVTASAGSGVSASADVAVLRVPTSMESMAGEDQVGRVGEPLTDSVRMRLLDRHGEPVAGVAVAFTVASGDGSVGAAQVTTGSDGSAATAWTLGTGAGEQTLRATCPRLSTPHEVRALALAGPPARMVLVEGGGQSGTVAEPLTDSIGVQVFDGFDNPAHGAVVTWEPDDAEASFHPSVSTAGTDGIARARWNLGIVAGSQSAQAVVGGVAAVVVSASAGPGAPHGLVVTRGSDQTLPVGTVADTLEVKAVDRWGNAVPDVGVEWAVTLGGGDVVGVGSATAADGLAAAEWTLGSGKGEQVVRARSAGIPEVLFRATAVNSPAAIHMVDGDGQEGVYGEELARPLAVFVADAFLQPVEGARISWQVIDGNGRVDPVLTRTDADGFAYTHWTVGTTGIDSVEAAVQTVKLATYFGAEARQKAVLLELSDTGFTALGDTMTLQLTGRDINGDPLDASTLALARVVSGNPDVVRALWDGRLVSKANGEARILAELDGAAVEATVRVEQRAAHMEVLNELFYGEVVLRVRDRTPLELNVYDANDNPMDPVGLRTRSDNPVVARVIEEAGGPLLAADYPGYATITLQRDTVVSTIDARVLPGEAIAAGASHTCALAPSGDAYCWGYNDYGQLGIGYLGDEAAPMPVAGGLKFQQIAGGYTHSCGVTRDAELYCWGANNLGQIGDGTDTMRVTPTYVMGGIASVALSHGHTCALAQDRRAYCWGLGKQLGIGVNPNAIIRTPMEVFGGLEFSRISAGAGHTCALDPRGRVYCWGNNAYGQVGDGTGEERYVPAVVGDGYRYVEAARYHTCGIKVDGQVYCWGRNQHGQLGDGTQTDRWSPVRAAFDSVAVAVAGGDSHTCALTSGFQVYCWGRNASGQLGDNTTADRTTPGLVYGGDSYSWITAGYYHTCALGAVAHCWGSDNNGRLGDGGEGIQSAVPVPVSLPPGVIFAHLPPDWTAPTVQEMLGFTGSIGD